MKWTDTLEIAIALSEKYPDTDPLTVRSPTCSSGCRRSTVRRRPQALRRKDPRAIQMAWIDEVE